MSWALDSINLWFVVAVQGLKAAVIVLHGQDRWQFEANSRSDEEGIG